MTSKLRYNSLVGCVGIEQVASPQAFSRLMDRLVRSFMLNRICGYVCVCYEGIFRELKI
jgi:hypothetical protein